MNRKNILWVSVSLIALGVIGMIYSFNMQVTRYSGGDIVNIYLLSRQQNILIVSGIIFIAGIMLFVLYHSNKKSENDISQDVVDSESSPDSASNFYEIKQNFFEVITKISPDFNYKRDFILTRLKTGLLVGLWSGFILVFVVEELSLRLHLYYSDGGSFFARTIGVLFFIVAILYSFRAIPMTKARADILVLNARVAIFSQVILIISFIMSEINSYNLYKEYGGDLFDGLSSNIAKMIIALGVLSIPIIILRLHKKKILA